MATNDLEGGYLVADDSRLTIANRTRNGVEEGVYRMAFDGEWTPASPDARSKVAGRWWYMIDGSWHASTGQTVPEWRECEAKREAAAEILAPAVPSLREDRRWGDRRVGLTPVEVDGGWALRWFETEVDLMWWVGHPAAKAIRQAVDFGDSGQVNWILSLPADQVGDSPARHWPWPGSPIFPDWYTAQQAAYEANRLRREEP